MEKNTPVPSWLDALPDGPIPEPPVETREQSLPFDKLSWENFERLILRIIRKEGEIEDCFLYGKRGQSQEGIDILSVNREQNNLRICYQCKKVENFNPSDIRTTVDKFLCGKWANKAYLFVLCIAIPLETTQQQDELDTQRKRLAEKGIKFSVWDGTPSSALNERLKKAPDLVDDFFGRTWMERFNGKDAAENLGDRLNGYELGMLRNRLLKLYSTIFAQHDPGLLWTARSRRSVDHRTRYVPVDVIEHIKTVAVSPNPSQTSGNYEISEDQKDIPETSGDHEIPQQQTGLPAYGKRSSGHSGSLLAYELRRSVLEWLQHKQDCLILGEPGYGKSALLRYLTLSILQPDTTAADTIDPKHFIRLPLWISFARLAAALVQEPNLSVEDFFKNWLHQHSFDDVYPLFVRAVSGRQVLLLLDGLDEAASESSGRQAFDRVITFLNSCDARILCTSRPRGYEALILPSTWTSATLAPLSDEQITLLAMQWFAIVESPNSGDQESDLNISDQIRPRAEAYLHAVKDNQKTLELARTPLLCQTLIELFRHFHRLPELRVTAYEQILELLLSKHPAARAQAGDSIQPVEQLDLISSDLKDILVRIAWELQTNDHTEHLNRQQCVEICAEYLADDMGGYGLQPGPAQRKAKKVVEQLVTQYGILVERAPNEVNFVHLSLQEYMAAEFMARKTPEEQIDQLSQVWLNFTWRETLVCWFGILGNDSKRDLAARAFQKLAELGETGEWQRMRSLELRTEIATTDLRLPVREVRSVIEDAAQEVETSAFPEFRTALARSLTLGALGSSVKEECKSKVKRWMPGHSVNKRLSLLQAFRFWEPSDILRKTLLRAYHDEVDWCRHAASETFVALFSASDDTLPTLKQLAVHHIRPEVRAAALHGLASKSEWLDSASEATEANIGSHNAELLLVTSKVRIHKHLHDNTDLDRLLHLWKTKFLDSWFHDELVNLLCAGWPQHRVLRKSFIHQLETQESTRHLELPLEYLIRCYSNDKEVAKVLAGIFERFEMHPFMLGSGKLWGFMRSGYKGHPVVCESLRAQVEKYRKEKDAVLFGPQLVQAFTVLGDDEARDCLLTSYETATYHHSRYWIATALFAGWSKDETVRGHIRKWADGPVKTAAPLAMWGKELVPETKQRETWLRHLASAAGINSETRSLAVLLEEFPDTQTKQLISDFIDESKQWYYHRISLESLFASKFPDDPKSLEIVERSLSEIDGPNPGEFAASFQSNIDVAERLLAASVTAPTDVRMTVTSILRSRITDYQTAIAMLSEPFAEETSFVRTNGLMVLAKAARDHPQDTRELADILELELIARGQYMDLRIQSAFSGLLELNLYEKVVEILSEQEKGIWDYVLRYQLDRDPVSISAIIEHWPNLEPLLRQKGLDSNLPVEKLLHSGYHSILEETSLGRNALDKYFETQDPSQMSSIDLEFLLRQKLDKESLRKHLIFLALNDLSLHACTAARLLTKYFSSSPDIWEKLSEYLRSPEQAITRLAEGVLGYLVLGWPEGVVATWVSSVPQQQRTLWSAKDRLLIAVAAKDSAAAETAAKDMLAETLKPWKYKGLFRSIPQVVRILEPLEPRNHKKIEDMHALHIWSQSKESIAVLSDWIESDNLTCSLAALSLAASGHADGVVIPTDKLLERFNAQMASREILPMDVWDVATGRYISWAIKAYSNLENCPIKLV